MGCDPRMSARSNPNLSVESELAMTISSSPRASLGRRRGSTMTEKVGGWDSIWGLIPSVNRIFVDHFVISEYVYG